MARSRCGLIQIKGEFSAIGFEELQVLACQMHGLRC